MKSRNKLIVLEGIDGVGKTTIALGLKKALKKKGVPVVFYEEYERTHPGFNPLKSLVKGLPVDGSHFFYLASAYYKSEIVKKLLRKHWVICDRYFYSTNAYHKAKGSNIKIQKLDDLLKPDHTFLLTLDEKIRQNRVRQKVKITKSDLVQKKAGSFPYKMESLLKKMNLINIDNASSKEDVVRKIMDILLKKKRKTSK